MSVSKSLFGTTYIIPETNETGWGPEVTGWIESVTDGLTDLSAAISTEHVPVLNSTTTSCDEGAVLDQTHSVHKVAGNGSAVTLYASTAIEDGATTGQVLYVVGTSDTNTVTILTGANTVMNGDITLENGDVIAFWWDGTDWIEMWRNT
jgi:hypothetical protein